jgi:hypothetical protein
MGASLLMLWLSSATIDSVGRLLVAQPQRMQQIIFTLTDPEKKSLFYYAANELNRYFMNGFGISQMVLGVIILGMLLLARQDKWVIVLAASMLLCVVTSYFLLLPQLIGLGRNLDFANAGQLTSERSQYGSLTLFANILEVVKLLLGAGLTYLLLKRGADEKRRRRASSSDEIAYPNYGKVDNP